MNGYLVAAGVVAVLTTLVHLIAGHHDPLLPMLRADLDRVAKRTLHAAWHLVTVNLGLSSAILLAAGLGYVPKEGRTLLVDLVALQFIGYAVVVVAIALAARVGVIAMPQPILFVPISILAWLGR